MTASNRESTHGVAKLLTLARIPDRKRGAKRHERLTSPERALYFWILRRFATAGCPTAPDIGSAAADLGLELGSALHSFAREDLVHFGPTGDVAVAYPFSGVATRHRVRFQNGAEVYAMCAIDALGMAAMFDTTIEIFSSDPLTGEPIRAELEPNGDLQVTPESAVMVTGARHATGASYAACCPVLNLFASPRKAERWLDAHPDVSGHVSTMSEAASAGRVIFGGVLRPLETDGG